MQPSLKEFAFRASSTAGLSLTSLPRRQPPSAVTTSLQLRVVDAIDKRGAGESAKDHGVGRANARAGEHRDRQLRNQRHVERDAIAFFNVRCASVRSQICRLRCGVVDK